jgi:hypothetical protein
MMQTSTRTLRAAALAALCYFAMAAGHAQHATPQVGDPSRWYVDDTTAQAQLRTLRKEIGAAFQEAQAECKRMPAADRGACMKDARNTYQQDMANAQQQRANAHPQQ